MILGIDPDIHKSGIAVLHRDTNCCPAKELIEMSCLSFVDILSFVKLNQPIIECVYIEAGWFNKKSSFHYSPNMAVSARIGKSVGENHATGKLLAQCIEHEQVKVILVKPTKAKLNAEQFKKLTKIQTRTNQETRDAAMLVWGR